MNREGEVPKRLEYHKGKLDEADCPSDPMELLNDWINSASNNMALDLPMVISTVGKNDRPSSRVVLLKKIDGKGLFFFTNYNSRKGRELELRPYAAVNFFWKDLERQIRLEGRVEKLSADESDEYFDSRPLQSRINAIVSPQSEMIPNRAFLEQAHSKLMKIAKVDPGKITRPEFWGGYIFYPDIIEFWQGRPGRLNDRIEYQKESMGWRMVRLGP